MVAHGGQASERLRMNEELLIYQVGRSAHYNTPLYVKSTGINLYKFDCNMAARTSCLEDSRAEIARRTNMRDLRQTVERARNKADHAFGMISVLLVPCMMLLAHSMPVSNLLGKRPSGS